MPLNHAPRSALRIGGRYYFRVPYGREGQRGWPPTPFLGPSTCELCGVEIGQSHVGDCAAEVCPVCNSPLREHSEGVNEDDFLCGVEDEVPRAKGLLDGAVSLSEAASSLRLEADRLEDLAQQGYDLVGPIEDDYGWIRRLYHEE